jgi:hypothetical protein
MLGIDIDLLGSCTGPGITVCVYTATSRHQFESRTYISPLAIALNFNSVFYDPQLDD